MATLFSERIARRSRLWWDAPRPGSGRTLHDAAHRLRERRAVRSRDDSDAVWRCCDSWPRTLVDKWNGREYAARHGCPLPELLWHGAGRPPLESLPEHYVIRPVRGANREGVWAVTGGRELMRERPATAEHLRRSFDGRRRRVPLVIEAFVRAEDGTFRLPAEIKCHVFGGTVGSVEFVDRERAAANSRRFYTPAWEPLPDPIHENLPISEVRHAPDSLAAMVELASRIGADLGTYMRIDFFASDEGGFFNEFSTAPVLGRGFTPYGDAMLGALWDEHCPDAV